jgi:hypothetical protein
MGGAVGDKRTVGIYLVGPSGQALFKYLKEAERRHGNTVAFYMNHTKQKPPGGLEYLPAITDRTKDMIKCAEVRVTRK